MNPWVAKQVAGARALEDQVVGAWAGVEMAVRSNEGETVFQFTDPQVPCLQLWGLTAELGDGALTRLVLFVAGETYETWTERIEIRRFDESILVFTSQADYDSIDWIPPEPPGVLV